MEAQKFLAAVFGAVCVSSCLSGCAVIDAVKPVPTVTSVGWSTWNPWADPGEASSTVQVQVDPAEIARVQELFNRYHVVSNPGASESSNDCEDAGTAEADVQLESGNVWNIGLSGCADHGTFEYEFLALITTWKKD